ncbi:uncharacterized protein C9orf50 homolog [Pteronotus mesoamericanus]|uniref:uncharacterized protein C9orf50 homolog n=1 Tax=Pteronotus mesoamericanus TaxID=1884717 RepID=UPI0023EB72AE|nr:uncharacterized protein C9orf50 homolog [Pteronotus parnellii mesoamericanus]
MPWRHSYPWAQQVAPKGFPGEGARRMRDPLLPNLPPRELRSRPGAGRSGSSRGGAEWWQPSSGESSPAEPGLDFWSPQLRLPRLPSRAPRAARSRTGLRSPLLPSLLLDGASRTPAPPHSRPGECEDFWRGSARKPPPSLGALLGEFLPSRFREFLRQLGAEWVSQPQPPTSSESPHQRGVSERWQGLSPQCPNCSFLPDLRGQSSKSLKKILLDQIPTPGPLRRDPERSAKVKKANKPRGLQAPKPKAKFTCSSSEEGSGHHRRCPPFRVRFADETLWDSVLRYWERRCAFQQDITEDSPDMQSAPLERVLGSVGRWLESVPKGLDSTSKEEAPASSAFSWDSPGLPIPELQDYLSEDISVNSSLPYIPRATTQRQQRDCKTFLGAHSILDQVDKSPYSWSQELESFLPRLELHRKRGRPKGYQPFFLQ